MDSPERSGSADEETILRRRERDTQTEMDAAHSGIDADTVIRVPRPPAAAPAARPTPEPPAVPPTPSALVEPAAPPALVEPAVPVLQPIDDVLHPLEPLRERVFAYGFRVNNGRAVSLETRVLIGRAPTPPRILTGVPPVLARVESPHKEVSSTHLELRQEGTLVIATDLRSTNGTTVTPPGRDTMMLRQGESVVVQPGTVVDIGDGNLIEILPLQSRESD